MSEVSQSLQKRRRRSRGSELVEFTLVFLPMLMFVTVLVATAWAIWAKSTLQRSVRLGVRVGVTLTAAQMSGGSCLTDVVKGTVQANSFGLLSGSTGLSKIKVNYFQPPPPNSSSAATDVSTQPSGNSPGNIMQVSVQNFSLVPLMPRITSWKTAPDSNPMILNVNSADLIEPSRSIPCIGTAP